MDPEVELIRYCARTTVTDAQRGLLRSLIAKSVDWDRLLQLARRHRIKPLLYQHLRSVGPPSVPPFVAQHLRDEYESSASRNTWLASELIDLLAFMERSGIRTIPYKGPVLAVSAYGDLALRTFLDLDILVHQRDYENARRLLLSRGFRSQLEVDWEIDFVHQTTNLGVDLHRGILPRVIPLDLNFDRLWARRQEVRVCGASVRSLHPEDHLIVLSIQLVKDLWQGRPRLLQVADVAELARAHPALNWASAHAHAKAIGAERMLWLALLIVEDMLGPSLPENVLSGARSRPFLCARAANAPERFFGNVIPPSVLGTFGFHLGMCDNIWFKARFVVSDGRRALGRAMCVGRRLAAPNDLDREFLPLPGALGFLHYLSRPIRIIITHRFLLVRESRRVARELVSQLHGPFS